MSKYELTVNVTYTYEVEADSPEEAEKQGWEFEDYSHTAEVQDIDVAELEDDEDGEETE